MLGKLKSLTRKIKYDFWYIIIIIRGNNTKICQVTLLSGVLFKSTPHLGMFPVRTARSFCAWLSAEKRCTTTHRFSTQVDSNPTGHIYYRRTQSFVRWHSEIRRDLFQTKFILGHEEITRPRGEVREFGVSLWHRAAWPVNFLNRLNFFNRLINR